MKPGGAPGRAWLLSLLLVALALGGVWAWEVPPARWGLVRPWSVAEGWRLLSCGWVHGNLLHWIGNVVGFVLLALLGWRARLTGADLLAFGLAAPLGHALLLLRDDWALYYGASGWLHAAAALVGLGLLRAGCARERRIGAAFLAVLALKLLAEAPWGPSLRQEALWGGFVTLPLAHSTGALAGALGGLLVAAWQRHRLAR